ncbi:MAG: YVTN family beta-propeller repeat-containing protein [Alistipes sp.]|nr:YVTN family beta-propeller repeat-containing protein [Alistipes sp.]
MKRLFGLYILTLAVVAGLCAFVEEESQLEQSKPLYISDIALYGDKLLAAEKGTSTVSLYDRQGRNRLKSWRVAEPPTGVATDGEKIFVTTSLAKGGVEVISPAEDAPNRFIATGRGACAPLLGEGVLYVCNQFQNTLSEIDLQSLEVVREVQMLREPKGVVASKDGRYLFVANFLPVGRANQDNVAAAVSVVDVKSFERVKDIPLATGSNAARGLALSPDGEYLFVTHNLGRFQVPTSQLQQGWMNTSAVSVISTRTLEYGGAVLLDELDRGAAGIWDVECVGDKMVITHSRTHEISVVDYPAFEAKYRQVEDKTMLSYDLKFMVGLRQRITLQGNGPRDFVADDEKVYIPTYFSDTLNIVSLAEPTDITSAALVAQRAESDIDKGEKYFNDATYCFQNWQSCNGCHPGEGRTDGLNWDNLNDGTGNPKNCKSLLAAHYTAPSMISGIRENAERAVRAGFKYIQFNEVGEDIALCVDAYLKSLKPVPSPYLVDGRLSERAKRGEKVFHKYGCAACHNGEYYTDCKMHIIGEDVEFEQGWDTPTLVEVWRTAPYLFDGRAATMEEVFSVHRHGLGKKSKITPEEIADLAEFVNSL